MCEIVGEAYRAATGSVPGIGATHTAEVGGGEGADCGRMSRGEDGARILCHALAGFVDEKSRPQPHIIFVTVTSYIATFADAKGQKFHGSVFWAKSHPRRLTVQICPHISDREVDYPVWTANATNNREGFEALVEKMMGRAKRMKVQLVTATENKFAPKLGMQVNATVEEPSEFNKIFFPESTKDFLR